jgi:FkbM family methyltransferase
MGRHDFKCFENEASQQTAKNILDGKVYAAFCDIEPVKVIVDIGANIGAFAVYFKNMHPDANIFCFEPNHSSFELLVDNTSYLPGIQCYNYGLYDIESVVRLYKGNIDCISDSIFPNENVSSSFSEVELKSASKALAGLQIGAIDILKIDTEGCEVNILRNLVPWLASVKAVYIEYHSELDRVLIDLILRKTHLLYCSRSSNPHRGELTYIHHDMEKRCRFDLIGS